MVDNISLSISISRGNLIGIGKQHSRDSEWIRSPSKHHPVSIKIRKKNDDGLNSKRSGSSTNYSINFVISIRCCAFLAYSSGPRLFGNDPFGQFCLVGTKSGWISVG